ncbi:MAG: porin family protein, partial [Alphaproteobacteria bacterium]
MNRIALTLLAGVAVLGFASSTYAADLIVDSAPMAPVYDAPAGNWDGAYIGAFAGYGWGTLTDEDGAFSPPGADYDTTGWLLGVNAGYNFTVSEAIVAGIVGDIAWSNQEADTAFGLDDATINWQGSIRGRLGFDGGAFLPYVTAGLAFANATVEDTPDEDTQTHIGWTAGAGVEFAVADNVSLDLQYRYSDFGTATYDIGGDTDISLTS